MLVVLVRAGNSVAFLARRNFADDAKNGWLEAACVPGPGGCNGEASMAEVSNAGADWGQRQSPEGDRPTASCGTDLF